MKWIIYMYTYIPSLLSFPPNPPIPPLYIITEHKLSSLIRQQLLTSYFTVYVRQSYSPSLSHPSPPLLTSTCLSLRLCLSFCPANWLICTIFLDSIYMHWYTIFVFLFPAFFTLYDRLYIHPHHYKWPNLSFLWLIIQCIYLPQLLYPFICWWI